MAFAPRSPSVTRSRIELLLIGAACEAIYLLYFLRRFPLTRYYRGDIDLGTITGHTPTAFLQFIGFVSVLFVLFALGWNVTRDLDDGVSLGIVLGFGVIFAATLVLVYPITAIDLYAYIDHSLVLIQYHHNPIFTPPATFSPDPLMALSDGWQGSGSPYGPLGIVIDAIPTLLVHRELLANLILLKFLFSAMGLAEAYAIYTVLRGRWPGMAMSGALLVAWNPLFLFEVSVNGHNDVAMMLFAVLGFASLADGELTLGPVLLVVSVLVKYTTIILLPLALLYAVCRKPVTERIPYLAVTGVACLAVAVLGYLPFWQGPDTIAHVLTQNGRYLSSFSSVLAGLAGPSFPPERTTIIGRVLFVPVYVYALWRARQDFEHLLRASFLTMFAFLVLALSNVESWYVIWPIGLGALVPNLAERLSMVLLSYGAALLATFFGFVWVWYGLSGPGYTVADNLSYFVNFLPAVAALLVLSTSGTSWKEMGAINRAAARDCEVPMEPADTP